MTLTDTLDREELARLDNLAAALPHDSSTAALVSAEDILRHVVQPAVTRHGPVGAYLGEFIQHASARVPVTLSPDAELHHRKQIAGARTEAQRLDAKADQTNDLRVARARHAPSSSRP
jgi:hypothetical protein